MNRRKFLGASVGAVAAAPAAAKAAMESAWVYPSPPPIPVGPVVSESRRIRPLETSLMDRCRAALNRERDKYDYPEGASVANIEALRSASPAGRVAIRRARHERIRKGHIETLMDDLKAGVIDETKHRWFWFLD